jgi:hypothetical protein
LVAMSQVLSQQAASDSASRVTPNSLLLTAALLWLINSLHARPDDGSAARSLMRAVLPLTDSDQADDTTLFYTSVETDEESVDEVLPYNPYGIVFLR